MDVLIQQSLSSFSLPLPSGAIWQSQVRVKYGRCQWSLKTAFSVFIGICPEDQWIILLRANDSVQTRWQVCLQVCVRHWVSKWVSWSHVQARALSTLHFQVALMLWLHYKFPRHWYAYISLSYAFNTSRYLIMTPGKHDSREMCHCWPSSHCPRFLILSFAPSHSFPLFCYYEG